MWIWWIVSLIVLIACFIFAYRMIVSSYDFLPADKKNLLLLGKNKSAQNAASAEQEIIKSLKSKLQSVEENNAFYELQFSKFQQRLNALEEISTSPQALQKEDDEDWKELYYEENEKKEKLENELDETRQQLDEYEHKFKLSEENSMKWSGLQSDYDARLHDLQSMQNHMGLLQRQLEAAAQREKELEQLLAAEIAQKKKFAYLESENTRLKTETDDLRKNLDQINQQRHEYQARAAYVQQLESKIAIYEEEKAKIISNLELMVSQNKVFS